MPTNDCGICAQIVNCGGHIDQELYKSLVVRLLCEIADQEGGGGGVGETVGLNPLTTGGLTTFRRISTADVNAAVVKGSAGRLYGWALSNNNANPIYVKLYNKASAPDETDVPLITFMIPGGGSANFSTDIGIAFATGIGLRITTGAADADTGAVGAAEVIINLLYA